MGVSDNKQNFQERLIKKAWEDAEFKKELLSNPKAAIQKELEILIPDDIEIKVVEETSKTFYLVLPVNPIDNEVDSECSEDLEPQTMGY